MVNSPLIRPYSWGGGSFGGGSARIPLKLTASLPSEKMAGLGDDPAFGGSLGLCSGGKC